MVFEPLVADWVGILRFFAPLNGNTPFFRGYFGLFRSFFNGLNRLF